MIVTFTSWWPIGPILGVIIAFSLPARLSGCDSDFVSTLSLSYPPPLN